MVKNCSLVRDSLFEIPHARTHNDPLVELFRNSCRLMDAFRGMENVSKESKGFPKTVKTSSCVNSDRYVTILSNKSSYPLSMNRILVYFKSLVYKRHSKTLEHLRSNMRAEMGNIPVDMLEKVAQSF
ncbi:hypothetical protein TNCV_4254521 [Trichonephila clavipes]|nr:hypothetical protein TNCV_4254521 [Trichonephila clavipes]